MYIPTSTNVTGLLGTYLTHGIIFGPLRTMKRSAILISGINRRCLKKVSLRARTRLGNMSYVNKLY